MPATKKKPVSSATACTTKTNFDVLVTGFDRWTGHPNEPNPSYLITSSLPGRVTLQHFSSGTATINITIHQAPVSVHFAELDELVPRLYDKKHYDFVLHTGVAPGIKWYEVETFARRSGYKNKDDSGGRPTDGDHSGYGGRQGPAQYETCVLDMGISEVLKAWKAQCKIKDADLRVSRDAGLFVCEYITYASLAYLHHQKDHLLPLDQQTGVAFLHAPADRSDAMVGRGKEVYIALIKALVARRLDLMS